MPIDNRRGHVQQGVEKHPRANTAREQGVPAYVIFHDSTLRAIATNAPEDLDELARIPGIGASKLDRYGEDVLQQLFDAA